MKIILDLIRILYYHVDAGLRCILQAKTILQANSTSNNTDNIENKIK